MRANGGAKAGEPRARESVALGTLAIVGPLATDSPVVGSQGAGTAAFGMPNNGSSAADMPATGTPNAASSTFLDFLFAATIAAMFSGLHQSLGPVKVQLSDGLAIMTMFLAALKGFTSPRPAPTVLGLLIVYLLYYTISALFVSLAVGIKEIVQLVLLFGFLFVTFGYYRTRSTDRVLILTAALTVAVLVYNISWHVAHGEYVGWKQLNEPKTVFTVLPLLIILLVARFGRPGRQLLFVLAACAAAVVILLSGERKAYIFAVLALAIWAGPTKMLRYAFGLALLAPVLAVLLAADKTGYLNRQIDSLAAVTTQQPHAEASLSGLLDEHRAMTLSTAQREFSKRIAHQMWEEQPLLGIGTGAFAQAILKYSSVPPEFRMNIHGEFYRALYENGIVGLSLYVACWIGALATILLQWSQLTASGHWQVNRIRLLCVTMFVIYCAFEASKELTQICLCALPFVCAIGARSARRASEPAGHFMGTEPA